MTGLELVAGFLAAWAVRKARRVGGRLDEEFDAATDVGLDRLHEVIAGRLGEDPRRRGQRDQWLLGLTAAVLTGSCWTSGRCRGG